MYSQTEALKPRLLVIDDDKNITEYIMTVGQDMGFAVNCVHDFNLVSTAVGEFDPHVSILDLIANVGVEGSKLITSGTIYWKDFIHQNQSA